MLLLPHARDGGGRQRVGVDLHLGGERVDDDPAQLLDGQADLRVQRPHPVAVEEPQVGAVEETRGGVGPPTLQQREPERAVGDVRDRADHATLVGQQRQRVAQHAGGVGEVLEDVTEHEDVEGPALEVVGERRVVEVGDDQLLEERPRLLGGLEVVVDAPDPAASGPEGASEDAPGAAHVEDPDAGADELDRLRLAAVAVRRVEWVDVGVVAGHIVSSHVGRRGESRTIPRPTAHYTQASGAHRLRAKTSSSPRRVSQGSCAVKHRQSSTTRGAR